jgi:hypothetical protein
LDIDWKNYDFDQHLSAAKKTRPFMTVARDIENCEDLDLVLFQADQLSKYAKVVVVVPKDVSLSRTMEKLIPDKYIFGYSVPTRYGGTMIPPESFKRPVHLLGGRPDVQRSLADRMQVASFDCNRFTFDAAYGDYFDGEIFRPHPIGGYDRCLEDSIANINALWESYDTLISSLISFGNKRLRHGYN